MESVRISVGHVWSEDAEDFIPILRPGDSEGEVDFKQAEAIKAEPEEPELDIISSD